MTLSALPLPRRAVLGALASVPLAAVAGFRDPLDAPAPQRSDPQHRPLLAVATAGSALVAVGSRGLIVRSEDGGRQWRQCEVPVQSDLLAVHFPTPQKGWAVGHDGVVLHSDDGGRRWVRQLDGRSARTAFEAFYNAPETQDAQALAAVQKNLGNGPSLPFLDVWFEDERRGVVVGSFGLIARTEDGGRSWLPWMHRIDNPDQYNLNAVRGLDDQLVIAGEHGSVFVLDRAAGRFRLQDTGYLGSFFGVAGHGNIWIAYGLRGVAYRRDAAQGKWSPVALPGEQTLTAGVYQPEVGFVLVDAAGRLLLGGQDGQRWQVRAPKQPMRAAGLAFVDSSTLVVAALDGLHVNTLDSAAR